MIQFADKMKSGMADPLQTDQVNTTAIFAACDRECGDAYSDDIFKRACLDGCQHQTPTTSGQLQVIIDDSSPLFPFANKLMNDAMGKFDSFKGEMKSQWDSFRKWFKTDDLIPENAKDGDDDAKVVGSLQNMGDGLLNLLRQLNLGGQDNDKEQQQKPRLFGGLEDVADHMPNRGANSSEEPLVAKSHPKHVDGSEFKGPSSVENEDENGEPIIIVQMIPIDVEDEDDSSEGIIINEPPSPPSSGDVMYADADDGWLACLARRTQNLSILSRWLLCLALMLSILCMFWLCLALMRTQRQQRRRLYTQYRAGKSDVIYFTPPPAYEKSPSSAAYLPLNKEEQKAPPSPPPAYETTLESVKTEIPKTESA